MRTLLFPVNNPLSLQERIYAASIIEHDLRNVHSSLYGRLYNTLTHGVPLAKDLLDQERVKATYAQGKFLLDAHASLVTSDTVSFADTGAFEIGEAFDTLALLYRGGQVRTGIANGVAYRGNLAVLQMALNNLIKNSKHYGQPPIDLTASHFSGAIESPVLVPEGQPTQGDFLRFQVHDAGPGFPGPPLESLARGVTTEGRGLGLNLVSLACQYLGNVLEIRSHPGDTSVAIYHPLA